MSIKQRSDVKMDLNLGHGFMSRIDQSNYRGPLSGPRIRCATRALRDDCEWQLVNVGASARPLFTQISHNEVPVKAGGGRNRPRGPRKRPVESRTQNRWSDAKSPPIGGLSIGADDGIRTRDPHLGKVVLYH